MVKLNMKTNPCEPSSEYVFDSCIGGKIAKEFGCKPFWMSSNMTELDNCTKARELTRFLDRVRESQGMDDATLYENFGCLKPCSYMNYQVQKKNLN